MKRRYTRGGGGKAGWFLRYSRTLCFSSIPVNGFLLGGGWLAAASFRGHSACSLLCSFSLLLRRFFFIRSRASSPPLPPSLSSLHRNSTSTRNDCIVDVDTSNVSRTIDKTALLFLLSARPSFFHLFPSLLRFRGSIVGRFRLS